MESHIEVVQKGAENPLRISALWFGKPCSRTRKIRFVSLPNHAGDRLASVTYSVEGAVSALAVNGPEAPQVR